MSRVTSILVTFSLVAMGASALSFEPLFDARIDYGAGQFPVSVFSADLDGDGDYDLAVANAFSDNVSVLMNLGPPCCVGNRGDLNGDGDDANILDLTFAVDRIFRGGPASVCPEEADINADGTPHDILDLTFLVDRIFRGGPAPGGC